MPQLSRGEVWLVNLNPARGHEQAGVPGIPFHVEVNPPEGGVKAKSFIKCEDDRCVAKERLSRRWGKVSGSTLAAVEDRLLILLGL